MTKEAKSFQAAVNRFNQLDKVACDHFLKQFKVMRMFNLAGKATEAELVKELIIESLKPATDKLGKQYRIYDRITNYINQYI